MKLLKKIAAVLGFFLLPIVGYAAYGGITWGLDGATDPKKIGVNINGVWYEFAFFANGSFVSASATIDVTRYFTAAQKADIATGSPTLDLKTPIQTAEDALGTLGGELYFPKGVYRWDSTVVLSSNRHVRCEKGAVFKPIYKFQLFANDNYVTVNLGTDLDPPTDANQTDHDFEISGCKFDWTAITDANSPSPIWSYDSTKPAIFVKAKNVYFHDNEIVGSDPPKFNGSSYYGHVGSIGCVSSNNCRYERNIAKGVHESLDCWGGGNGCYYIDNRVELFDNSSFQRGDHYCLGFNGMGSIANFHNTIENLVISGNYCITKGWSSCYQFDPLSAGSKVKHVKITNNVCEAKSGTTNNGIYGRGQVEDATIEGNTIIGVDALPINVTDFFSTGGPFTCTDCISTTNGSDIATVAIPTLTDAKATVGNYLLFSAGTGAVGGITFASKYFLITEVTSGVNVKVQADASAGSSATGGGAVSTNVWWGAPDGVKIANNHFDGSSYLNSALVYGVGTNLHISDTSAVGGTYGAITFASSIIRAATTLPLPVVYGTSGSAGTGIAGSSGDNIDNYALTRNPRTPFPAIVLACGADPTTAALVNGEMWCNTTALRTRIGGSLKTIALLETAQAFTASQQFVGTTFGSTLAASSTDLSKHIALYSTTYGFGITSNRLNYVVPTGANHAFVINGVDIAFIDGSGMHIPAGSLALNYASKNADYVVTASDSTLTFNCIGTCTVTLPSPASRIGHLLTIRTVAAQTVVSASSNVVPLAGGGAGTAILAATAGKWAVLQSDGTNYQIIQGN